jgi:hypothetical protein
MAIPLRTEMPASAIARIGKFRWTICGLLFLAATINYIDRQVIGILKPTLQAQFGWTEIDYGDMVFSFQLAYAIGFLFAGPLMDRIGTKRGFALALIVWSLAAMAHAEVGLFGPGVSSLLALVGLSYSASVSGFIAARFLLGLGESVRHRAVQLRHQRRRAHHSGHRALDHVDVRLVGRLHCHRRAWLRPARGVVDGVRASGATPTRGRRRARVHLQRPGGAGDPRAVAQAVPASPDVGVRAR